jgi:hypothetical protein
MRSGARNGFDQTVVALAFAAGRLGCWSLPEGLADEPAPSSPGGALALAAKYGVDGWALWQLVREDARYD